MQKTELITRELAAKLLPERDPQGHKGSFGSALIIAGSWQYTGAALLAGQACLRSGPGLVYMVCPDCIRKAVASAIPEAIWVRTGQSDLNLNRTASEFLQEEIPKKSAVLLGPGLGQNPESQGLVETLFRKAFREAEHSVPTVIDADGLNLLANLPDWERVLPDNTILTPHPGEFSRLTGLSIAEIQANRESLTREFAQRWQCTLALKGAGTLIANQEGKLRRSDYASSALAHGGSGDVLAGIITGLLAQGTPSFDAASLGVWAHAEAARRLENSGNWAGSILPTDLISQLCLVYASLSK